MTYPPQGQQPPYGQQPYNGQYQGQPAPYPQQQPVPYGQPQQQPYAGGYPAQQPMPRPQQPMQVQQVGMSVTKPAWTCGEMLLMFCTLGMAYPIIWMRRRSKTTVTRHR